ncbi:coenzyme F420-0:L-glutamate ligase [Candidatus Bathyarchaeota archaeon]|nr:coenzyme F420-0:L-glutamate ligase [Candidatus Bathyarchaeota archaeon]
MAPRHRYRAKRLRSPYWRPGFDYVDFIVSKVKNVVENRDVLVISEKAISAASGNMIDEAFFKPSLTAGFLARFWMRIV